MRVPRNAMMCLRLILCVVAGAVPLRAQDARPLRGVVFDSLRSAPLADATVRVRGTAVFAQTDTRGRFRADSVPAGALVLDVEHPLLDSIGLFALSARVQHDGRTEHRLGVPSFATITRAVCGRTVSGDSALLYGAVLDAESQPVRHAVVAVAWQAFQRSSEGKLAQQRLVYATETDSLGRFAACGLPADEPFTLDARGADLDSVSRVTLVLPAQTGRVLRQEVMLPAVVPVSDERVDATRADTVRVHTDAGVARTDSTRVPAGVIRGFVRGLNGEPIAGARVGGEGIAEAVSDSSGRFYLPRVPTGSRQLEVVALGRTPQTRLIQMRVRDTLEVSFVLDRVTTLAGMKTEGTVLGEITRSYEERRRLGLGRYRDSTELERLPIMASALDGFPNLIVDRKPGPEFRLLVRTTPQLRRGISVCEPRIFIDGRLDDIFGLNRVQPRDIAWMEIYVRPSMVPIDFAEGIKDPACGVVAVMTKRKLGR